MADPRLYVLLAHDAPRAVVLRRGPSHRTLLITWSTLDDTFTEGQWISGRVYERRCNLSPSGERLLYHVGTYRPPLGTWTAVSRPPYFTATLLWPAGGDGYGGGGLFASETRLLLNHGEGQMRLGEGFQLPPQVTVEPFGGSATWSGDDAPIEHARMVRDGWVCEEAGDARPADGAGKMGWVFDPPRVHARRGPGKRNPLVLRRRVVGLHEKNGPWHVVEHDVTDEARKTESTLGRTDWADWDRNGDLLFARGGKLFRVPLGPRAGAPLDLSRARALADFGPLRFRPLPPPEWATRW